MVVKVPGAGYTTKKLVKEIYILHVRITIKKYSNKKIQQSEK